MTAPLLHTAEKLKESRDYLNNRQNNIQFTIGTATEGHMASLDIDIYSKEDGSMGHKSTQETDHQKPLTVRSHHPAKSTHISTRSTSSPNCT